MTLPEQRDADAQDRVREAMEHVGGYWRPLAAVARLLEELGELAEHNSETDLDPVGLAGELADLWIITTALADQFLGRVPEPQLYPRRQLPSDDLFAALLTAAGHIARIVNFYDGPKTPRSLDGWMPLERAVIAFHRAVADVAHAQQIDLRAAVDEKLRSIPPLDVGRFRRAHDPSTAPVLRRFAAIRSQTLCPYAAQARLWGGPDWSELSFDTNIEDVVPTVTAFTKATTPERLDALIIPGPPCGSMKELGEWFRRFLIELSRRDPKEEGVMDGPVDQAGWQFAFNRRRMFVAVFSPLYGAEHPRHSPDETYVFMQPEDSFDRKGVGSSHTGSSRKKAEIRRQFTAAGRPYPPEAKDARIEAPLYLLPRWEGDEETRWWEPHE
jgi:NTP pyrophosphatase (non-canonical NTP hydrolase)